jgi:L-arabinose isomerase
VMSKPKIGLLPLYLELYDRVLPQMRARIEDFYKVIAAEMTARGLDVITSPVCRLYEEVETVVKEFEAANADGIITIHLAYSPSLESAPIIARSRLPVFVLDTTPTSSYGPLQNPEELLYNHGIHGVQDFCNLLIREGKAFAIAAGHWLESTVLDKAVAWAFAARLAANFRRARVGLIGKQFAGMADFQVPFEVLKKTIGMEVIEADIAILRSLVPAENDLAVEAEIASDLAKFQVSNIDEDAHRATTRACLAVREWINREALTAFTMNFEDITRSTGIPTVPFLEASKAMARGQGYAGEGDVLTAGFVGALLSVFPETTFVEMFCPDWTGNSILLSHMGELNLALADDKPVLVAKNLPWIDTAPPVLAVGRFRGGRAVLANLAPMRDNSYRLIIAPITVLDIEGEDLMQDSVRGWFRSSLRVENFLEEFSRVGGTHHSALVYGNVADELRYFGEIMGWEVVVLE